MKKILHLLAFLPFIAQAQYISTIAGTTSGGYSGDGGQATAAQISQPAGTAFDNAGNMYIADRGNHVIRKVTPAGIITTVAGNGTLGAASGSGGAATATALGSPMGICVDSINNIYFADNSNHLIRKVSAAGIITTIAGNGVPIYTGSGIPATASSVASPTCVAIDHAGNLYIGDAGNKVVMKINDTGLMTLFAGNHGAGPIDGDGGPATNAHIGSVAGLCFDNEGNLYIADGNTRVRMVDTGGIIHTVAGSGALGGSGDGGPATAATLDGVAAVAADGLGNLFISAKNSNVIRKVDPTGIISRFAGLGPASPGFFGDGGPAILAKINGVSALTVSPTGKLVLSDQNNNRVRIIDQCLYATITSPLSTTVTVGTNANFFAGTTISPVTYQWQGNSGSGYFDLPNILPYTGVTTASLTILNATTTIDNTTYRCVISKGPGCNNDTTAAALLHVVNNVGIAGISGNEQGTIYPNPAHDYVDVNMLQNCVVTLYNEVGSVVFTKELSAQTNRIDLKGLSAGLYIIKITSGTETIFRKLNKL
ncbi:NHL domain-containing protein [Flavipsychrobacter stenotrophus]|nr:T9SS type A sorting domain-containing protein [Flavipsychrobacter stenotrophus]